MKRYAYYPGCSLEKMTSEYDVSFRNVCDVLGIELEEPRDWFCCGAGMVGNVSPLLGLAVPLKNLVLARETGLGEFVSPCSACYNQFKRAQHEISEDLTLRADLEEIVEAPLEHQPEVLHPLEMLLREVNGSKPRIERSAPELRVACYYGCLLTRPPKIVTFDDCEDPRSMDRLLQRFGIQTIDWSQKTRCCGAFYAMVNPDRVLELTREILQGALEAGANAIAVACPVCHLNLDSRQPEVNDRFGTTYGIPVFYFSQLLGFALGVPTEGLGLWRHVVDPQPLLSPKAAVVAG
ncbi:MAG: CoB--CoM heterodisulfide reductase iron-sulfur subunit B family protein [Thermoanaerobaculia bacterium]